VDGPPGTGKTKVGTIAASKYLLEAKGHPKVAYLCYTHFASEHAQESLYSYGFGPSEVIRLHPSPAVTDEQKGIVGCWYDLKPLSNRQIRLLKASDLLLCTLHSSGRAFKIHNTRPKIIVDEFSQVNPAMFFSVLRKARYANPEGYVLLGDPMQLPVITTQPLLRPNIGNFIRRRKPIQSHQLEIQHRMHEDVCEAVNSLRASFNTFPIRSANEVKNRNLEGLDYTSENTNAEFREVLDPANPFVIINTDTLTGASEQRVFGGSITNIPEADLAAKLVKAFYECFVKANGKHLLPVVLSPYAAQIGEISSRLPEELRRQCVTIYRAQGREFPCVIISFVRNNPSGHIGFLDEAELRAQTYVGCSRAQAKLVLLLSSTTFLGHRHLDFEHLYQTPSAKIIDAQA
jgi:hypothetical protein